jgi:hypothetical protein
MSVPRIDTHAEWILAYIARGHAAAVWRFLGRRILEDQHARERKGRYEAIPYQFHRLPEVLSQDAASAIRVTRSLYTPDDTLFQFPGARLLSAQLVHAGRHALSVSRRPATQRDVPRISR